VSDPEPKKNFLSFEKPKFEDFLGSKFLTRRRFKVFFLVRQKK